MLPRSAYRIGFLGTVLASLALFGGSACARSHHATSHHASHHGHASRRVAYGDGGHVIQCVAFARADTGIELSGNARNWWDNAAGVYERGSAPEVGSVLSFQATERMHLGHVAVVSNVVSARVVQIDQSHWNSNGISRAIDVVDVSPENDWTEVRVALGHNNSFGAIYPTDGFIYPRPDGGMNRNGVIRPQLAVATDAGQDGVIVPTGAAIDLGIDDGLVPRHHRSIHRRHAVTMEVAEAPDTAR